MPVTTEKDGVRSVEMTFEVPGTPEQVWQAVATGPGISAWFVPAEVEERVGGAVKFDLGGGSVSTGVVTAWSPPHRIAYEEPGWSGDAPPLATEFIVEAASGGTCRVRLVHSLPSEDPRWDAELGGMENGWPPFFEVLAIYLRHFPGEKSASVRPMGQFEGPVEAAWTAFLDGLGLADAKAGDRIETAPGAPKLTGVVERAGSGEGQRELLVRLDAPSPGVALPGAWSWGGKTHVAVSLFLYGAQAETVATQEAAAWDAWMAQRFPMSGD